jgi:hypothetical protein
LGSWETEVEVAAYIRTLDLPATILHPTAFMELMTEPKFFPPASVWHLMPRIMGSARPVGWLTVEDLAVIAAKAFGDPDRPEALTVREWLERKQAPVSVGDRAVHPPSADMPGHHARNAL